jgi:hydroxymethylpyrimidine pyrophosphatase-like HAD family hydrolase
MQRYIFLDLDDTLFQTLRKCANGAADPALQVRARLADGKANSFATAKQQWLWDWLSRGFRIVPVTAREMASFTRVELPFVEEVVINHGAVILDKQRQADPVWMAQMQQALALHRGPFVSLWAEIEAYCRQDEGYKARLVVDFGVTWYGYVKHRAGTEDILQHLLDTLIKPHPAVLDGSLYWHINGNNLALLPRCINKESAVAYLLARYQNQYGELLTFAAGDSRTDAPFLALCDYALIPKQTQLGAILAAVS